MRRAIVPGEFRVNGADRRRCADGGDAARLVASMETERRTLRALGRPVPGLHRDRRPVVMDVTGSKMPIVLRCAAAAALPIVTEDDPPQARRGTTIHRFIELCAKRGRDAAIQVMRSEVDAETLALLLVVDTARLPLHLASEAAFAYNWRKRSARPLDVQGRAYVGIDLDEIPLTIDVVGVELATRRAYIGDFKSGRTWQPAPSAHGQVMLGALAATAVNDCDLATVSVVRIDEDGEAMHLVDDVDRWALDEYADQVEQAMIRVDKARGEVVAGKAPDTVTGEHCRYCPAFKACPAQTALVRVWADEVEPQDLAAPITPEVVARVYAQVMQGLSILERAKGEIYAYAARTPIELPDGKVLGPIEVKRGRVDGPIVHRVVTERFGPAAAATAVEMKSSKAALRRLIIDRLQPGQRIATKKGDGELDKLIVAVRDSGGVTETRHVAIRVTVPEKLYTGPALPAAAHDEDAEL